MAIEIVNPPPPPDDDDQGGGDDEGELLEPGQLAYEALRDIWRGLDADARGAVVMAIQNDQPWSETSPVVGQVCTAIEAHMFEGVEDDEDEDLDDDDEDPGDPPEGEEDDDAA